MMYIKNNLIYKGVAMTRREGRTLCDRLRETQFSSVYHDDAEMLYILYKI